MTDHPGSEPALGQQLRMAFRKRELSSSILFMSAPNTIKHPKIDGYQRCCIPFPPGPDEPEDEDEDDPIDMLSSKSRTSSCMKASRDASQSVSLLVMFSCSSPQFSANPVSVSFQLLNPITDLPPAEIEPVTPARYVNVSFSIVICISKKKQTIHLQTCSQPRSRSTIQSFWAASSGENQVEISPQEMADNSNASPTNRCP
jgi:hypothetical protein